MFRFLPKPKPPPGRSRIPLSLALTNEVQALPNRSVLAAEYEVGHLAEVAARQEAEAHPADGEALAIAAEEASEAPRVAARAASGVAVEEASEGADKVA